MENESKIEDLSLSLLVSVDLTPPPPKINKSLFLLRKKKVDDEIKEGVKDDSLTFYLAEVMGLLCIEIEPTGMKIVQFWSCYLFIVY